MKTEDFCVGAVIAATKGWFLQKDGDRLKVAFNLSGEGTKSAIVIEPGTKFVIESVQGASSSPHSGLSGSPTTVVMTRLAADGTHRPGSKKILAEVDTDWTDKSLMGMKTPVVGKMTQHFK